jgi:hypothetical protein
MNMKIRKGKHWMIQSSARWAGPFNFGIHVALRRGGMHYIDIHLPFTVITIGDIESVEYPNGCWFSSRDSSTGVKYDNSN